MANARLTRCNLLGYARLTCEKIEQCICNLAAAIAMLDFEQTRPFS
jgi:hypothetical protein